MKLDTLKIIAYDEIAGEGTEPLVQTGDDCLELTYVLDAPGEQIYRSTYVAIVNLLDNGVTFANVSDVVLSPSILRALRPILETYLVGTEGRAHLHGIHLHRLKAPDEGIEEPTIKDRLSVNESYGTVATYNCIQWDSHPFGVDDLSFDILEYSRSTPSGTTWDVVEVFAEDNYAFDIVEATGGNHRFKFRVRNIFAPSFVPKVGMQLSITMKGEFLWGVNKDVLRAITNAKIHHGAAAAPITDSIVLTASDPVEETCEVSDS